MIGSHYSFTPWQYMNSRIQMMIKITARMCLHIFFPLAKKGGRTPVPSSTWDGKVILVLATAHSTFCIITLSLQGALIIFPLIFQGDMYKEELATFLSKNRWINKEHERASFSRGDLSKAIALWQFSDFKDHAQPQSRIFLKAKS